MTTASSNPSAGPAIGNASQSPLPPTGPATTTPTPQPKRWRWWIIAIVAILAGLAWWGFGKKGSANTAPLTTTDKANLQTGTSERTRTTAGLTNPPAGQTLTDQTTDPVNHINPSAGNLTVRATNMVNSSVNSSNICNSQINTVGGDLTVNNIITNMPASMVVMTLMAWPTWITTNTTNTFTVPKPKVKVGEFTSMRVYKNCALVVNVEQGFELHPDVVDLNKVSMVWGNRLGCVTYEPGRQYALPADGDRSPIRCLIWLRPDSPFESVEFRFVVLPGH